MASPMMLYVVPKCELEIDVRNAKRAYLYNPQSPVKYTISKTRYFAFKSENEHRHMESFDGMLSPSCKVTLPRKIKERAGVPADAERFAYMYPPNKLAGLIDWDRQREYQVPSRESFHDNNNVRVTSTVVAGDPDEKAERDRQTGRAHAMILGAFVYFDEDMNILRINALCLKPMTNQLRLSGPWAMTNECCESMRLLGRLQHLSTDVFQEAGLVSLGWINPQETFQSKHISIKGKCDNGALVFMREDGSGIAYHVATADGLYFPQEDVEIVVDCLQSLGRALVDGNVKFCEINENAGSLAEMTRWKKEALKMRRVNKGINEIVANLKKSLKNRPYLLVHKACQAGLDKDYVFELIKEEGKDAFRAAKPFNWTPLHYACRFASKNVELIKFLIEESPTDTVWRADRFGRLPLHLACDDIAPLDVIHALLKDNERTVLAETNNMKMIPLHIACNRKASFSVIKALLDADTDEKSVRKKSIIGRLPLHMAIEEKVDPDVVELLLEKGNEEDIHAQFGGLLPLHLACVNGSEPKTVSLLLDKDVYNTTKHEEVSRADDLESEHSDANAFVALTSDGLHGMIPLHLALRNSSDPQLRNRMAEVTRLLLTKERKSRTLNIAPNMSDVKAPSGTFDLMQNRSNLTGTLARKNSILSIQSNIENSTAFTATLTGMLPLHLACHHNARLDAIKLLLDMDPNDIALHKKDDRGMKPIHYACNKQDADPNVIELLLIAEKEEDISKRTKQKISAKLSKRRRKEKHQVLSHSVDNRRRSPLLCAMKTGAGDDVIEILTRPEYFYLKNFDEHNVQMLGGIVNRSPEMKSHIISLLADRSHFTILFLELYSNLAAIITYIEASERLLLGTLSNLQPNILIGCVVIFVLRELAQLKSQGGQYFRDLWNIPELGSTILLLMSTMHIRSFVQDDTGDLEINRQLLIATGIMLIISFIFFCRSTFLPFARFVGGVFLIVTTLVPFFTISLLLLLVFTYSFRIAGDHEEECKTFQLCYMFTLQGFFSGSDDTKDILDVFFGVVAIVILLNVVVAIVGDGWDVATERASSMYWSFRVSYLLESRIFSVIQKNFMNHDFVNKLIGMIDGVPNIEFVDSIVWSKGVYCQVTTRDQYERPSRYFDADVASKIMRARSLQADLRWAQMESEQRTKEKLRINDKIRVHQETTEEQGKKDFELTEDEKLMSKKVSNGKVLALHALLKFLKECFIYTILIALGIPFGGWFWPVNFRKGVLSFGLSSEEKLQGDMDDFAAKEVVQRDKTESRGAVETQLTESSSEETFDAIEAGSISDNSDVSEGRAFFC